MEGRWPGEASGPEGGVKIEHASINWGDWMADHRLNSGFAFRGEENPGTF